MLIRSLLAVALLVSMALPLTARAQDLAPMHADALKDPARARISEAAGGLTIVRLDLRHVLGDWATVRAYPVPGTTDPSIVILRRANSTWTAVAGPGTGFAPDEDTSDPWLGALFTPSPFDQPAGQPYFLPDGIGPFQQKDIAFVYPSDATVTPDQVGYRLAGPATSNLEPAYSIKIEQISNPIAMPLDDWGYRRVGAIRLLTRMPELRNEPRQMYYFQTPANNVFQVDWQLQDGTLHQLWLAPKLGGPVFAIRYQDFNGAPESTTRLNREVVKLLLRTMQIGPGASAVEQPYYVDPIIGYRISYPPNWTVDGLDGSGANLSGPNDVAAVLVAAAEEKSLASFDGAAMLPAAIEEAPTRINGLAVRVFRIPATNQQGEQLLYAVQVDSDTVVTILAQGDLTLARPVVNSLRATA